MGGQPQSTESALVGGDYERFPSETAGGERLGQASVRCCDAASINLADCAEMGVTNRLKPKDVTSVCKVTTDPEDTPDALGSRLYTFPPRESCRTLVVPGVGSGLGRFGRFAIEGSGSV